MKNTKIVALGIMAFMAFIALCVFFAPAAAGIITATGVITAATSTEQAARQNVATLDMEDISQTITEMLPSRTPMDTIMRKINKDTKMEAMIHRYYSVASKPLYDIPNPDANGAGTSSGAPAKEYTYSSGDGLTTIYVSVTNSALWGANDTVLMRDLTLPYDANGNFVLGGAAGTKKYDVAFFVSYVSGSVVRLKPLNGVKGLNTNAANYVVPNFTAGTKMYFMGKAMNELDASTTPFSILPEPDTQYAQYFMAQVEESTFQAMTKKEVNWGFNDMERLNIYNMRATAEMSFINGALGWFPNPDATAYKHYTTEGIARRIEKALEYGTGSADRTVSSKNIVDWCKSVFVGTSGSEERYLFAGSGLIGSLHSVDTIQKQVNGKSPVVKWGINFREIVTEFGMLYIYHHPLFSATGWEDVGMILDLEHVRKHAFMPTGVRTLDLKTPGTKLAEAKVISEASCLTLSYPDCHAIIKPKA
jgi:hypothetical protein